MLLRLIPKSRNGTAKGPLIGTGTRICSQQPRQMTGFKIAVATRGLLGELVSLFVRANVPRGE
jgi:hypothetical protein